MHISADSLKILGALCYTSTTFLLIAIKFVIIIKMMLQKHTYRRHPLADFGSCLSGFRKWRTSVSTASSTSSTSYYVGEASLLLESETYVVRVENVLCTSTSIYILISGSERPQIECTVAVAEASVMRGSSRRRRCQAIRDILIHAINCATLLAPVTHLFYSSCLIDEALLLCK